ncbi:MAG: kinase [Leptolyngbya foveolarum]|uniref:Kinase n=1 Tax=Leptolyngbya foveolarum TaxID=47253 RepID=A0A2W4U4M4_9CYAN|nr:MAG: kinase [Leptolyngbya foveolarum]
MLYIFSGLPATGKSTLAVVLAKSRNAVYLRLDTIEQAIKESTGLEVGPEGYAAAYALAADNLAIGLEVVADSVNALEITRSGWRSAVLNSDCAFVELEIVCSDAEEHKRRVENRKATISGLKIPTWQQVVNRDYVEWRSDRILIDTAGETPQQSIRKMFLALGLSQPQRDRLNQPRRISEG